MRKTFTRFLKGVVCLYGTLLLCGLADAQTLTPRHISTGPNNPGYYEWLPTGYKPTGKGFPLMIVFSGNGDLGNGDSAELTYVLRNGPGQIITAGQWPDSFSVNNKTFRFIIIMPQYQNVPVLGDLDSIVNYSLKHYNVDSGRVYLTGLSDGGNNAWWYPAASLDRAYKIAAILPISAGQLWGGAQYLAQADVAIFATANRGDSLVPAYNTTNNIALVNSQTPPIKPKALDTLWPANGHDAWTETYDLHKNLHNGLNCFQWMLQYSRDPGDTIPTPPPPPPTVTLAAYTATLTTNQKEVNVNWTTSLERGNKYFIVQRSTDSVNFTNLDTTASKAPQGGGAVYQYTDASPYAGNDYYRLVSVDTTGNSTFYAILKVKVPAPAPPPPPPPTVDLSAYSATLTTNNKAVNVDWITVKETGNRYFIVQRSTDSINFINLGTVASTAKSGGGASYRYTDNSPEVGNDYYRLESVDSTGKDSLFPVLLVQVPAALPPPPVILPVSLTSYTVTLTPNGKVVDINWTTALEQGNKYFVVQRSADSVQFTSLDTIASEAPPGGGYAYIVVDSTPIVGNNYYRLESVDITGHDSLYAVHKIVVSSTTSTSPPSGPPLPVTLTVYTATAIRNDRAVNVIWTTASEQGNKYFVVQRSSDSIQFSNLDTVAAAGLPDSGASYIYTDNAPVPGNNYYRLQRFDVDENDTLYKVLTVPTGGRWDSLLIPNQLQLSPNPATGLVYLHLVDSSLGAVQVSVMDMQGRLLRVWAFQKQGIVWDQSVDVAGLAPGCYALQIRGLTTRYVRTILKK